MRSWLNLSIAMVLPFGTLCVHGQSTRSLSVGDGGPAIKATLLDPTGLALDENNLYIVESSGRRVRRVNLKTGIITTIAGGGGQCIESEISSRHGCLGWPQRVAVDSHGSVYVTDQQTVQVIKVGADSDSFTTVVDENPNLSSDSGHGEKAHLKWPAGIAVDPSGGLFFADHTAHTVYRFGLHDHLLEIIAGTGTKGFEGNGGPGKKAEFRFPQGIVRDKRGNLFIADYGNCRIQRVDNRTGIVTTVTGTEKGGSTCEGLSDYDAPSDVPMDVAVDQNGNVFLVLLGGRVQRFDVLTGTITTVAGNGEWGFSGDGGPATGASLHRPEGIALDKSGNLYISDTGNNRIRRVNLKTGIITTIAGNGPASVDPIL